MKAFLGTGLLGANFVKAMLKKGDQVQVWNRTAAKAKALEASGAKAFDEVAQAVKGADRIHLTLKDDAAVDEVLEKASTGFQPGVYIIDHTTTSAKGAVERTAKWKQYGYTYLHAPVFMGPKNALESTGTMLVSGNQQVIEKLQPELSAMTGKVVNFGPTEGKAASMKLIGNLFLIALTGGLVDTLSLAKSSGISSEEVLTLLDAFNPGAVASARIKKISEGDFTQPSWELNMARKDAGLMMQAVQEATNQLMVIPAIAKEMDHWIVDGHGHEDWTVIAKNSIP
jgi:3-hydroxyisobutyrate dehydrogenase